MQTIAVAVTGVARLIRWHTSRAIRSMAYGAAASSAQLGHPLASEIGSPKST